MGEWTFIAATYDVSSVSIYINGELDVNVPRDAGVGPSLFNSAKPLQIGMLNDSSGFHPDADLVFTGLIDELQIYNRALSESEIWDIYFSPGGICKAPAPRVVTIDIKPGSDPNSVNPRSKGLVSVALLTDAGFDASTVDASTVTFGPQDGMGARAVRGELEDVDGDGDLDMVMHFRVSETGFKAGDAVGHVTGDTIGGTAFHGEDTVRIIE